VVRRVGSTREKKVDVRILAATHKTLKQQVEAGTFREDLYHRLLVIRIEVPPLRLRLEDILPLANLLLEEASRDAHTPPKPLSPEARLAVMSHRWPGNVRELSHTVQRAMFAAQLEGSDAILPHHLDLPAGENRGNGSVALKDFLHHAETRHVRDVLRRCEGNRRKAAEALGISERHLYRLLA
jgi:DNA-binding NtrC family response regulator